MFSIITMASSTTNPVEIVNAIRVRLLRLYPRASITTKVPINDSGTATLGMMVAERLRRKRKITVTTSAMVSINSNSTSRTEARMVFVRSVSTVSLIAAGRVGWGFGRRSSVLLNTWMVLAPGWRWMLTITAGVSFIQAASLLFSIPSLTLATSVSMTGAPFL